MTQPFRQTQYRGYSTTTPNTNNNQLYDVELVKADLFNHFNTRKTERVRDSEYGSILKDMLFELKTEVNIQQVLDEVLRIIATEPRVTLTNVDLNTDSDNEIRIDMDLLYQPLDVQFEFKLFFDLQNGIIESEE